MGSSTSSLLRLASLGTAGPSSDTTTLLEIGRSQLTFTALLGSSPLSSGLATADRNREGRKVRPSPPFLGLAICAVAVLALASFADAAGNPKLLASAKACQIQRSDHST